MDYQPLPRTDLMNNGEWANTKVPGRAYSLYWTAIPGFIPLVDGLP
jgi:hypothetical protein